MAESPFLRVSDDVLDLATPDLAGLLGTVLRSGKPFRFRAPGFSMSPVVKDGDVVTVVPITGKISVGTIAVVQHPDTKRILVHRVVRVRDDRLVLRGDNNHEADGEMGCEDVLGHVIRVERRGREVRLALGAAGVVIAWLSRCGVLCIALSCCRTIRTLVRTLLRRTQ